MSTKSSAKAPAKKASVEKKAPKKAEKESKEEKKAPKKTASKKAPKEKKAPKPKVSTADAREKKRKDLLVEMVKEVKKQLADDDALSKEQLAAIKEIVGGILLKALPAPKGKRPSDKPTKPLADYFRFRKETLPELKKKGIKGAEATAKMAEMWTEFKEEKEDTLAEWDAERKAEMKKYKVALAAYNKKNGIETKTSKKAKDGKLKKINSFNLYRREMKKEDVNNAQASLNWGKMDDKEKATWKAKADKENEDNGFAVGKGSGKSKKSSKKSSDDEAEVEADGEGDEEEEEVEADGEGDEKEVEADGEGDEEE